MQRREIGHLSKKISDKFRYLADEDLKAFDLTSGQLRVLRYINKNGGSAKQKDIEKYLDVSHPTIVGIVSRLEKNGFIEKRTDTNDKRNCIIVETQKALNTKAAIFDNFEKREAMIAESLSESEIVALVDMLERINESLCKEIERRGEKNGN